MATFTKKMALATLSLVLATTMYANSDSLITVEEVPPSMTQNLDTQLNNEESYETSYVIPNAITLKPTNIITLRAIGLGVAPNQAINEAQAIALAKRAAIVDAYRQLGEKLHGIHINAKDTIEDAIVKNSIVKTKLYSIVRNAEVQETVWKDGLCQVEMTVKIDGRRWYRVLSNLI